MRALVYGWYNRGNCGDELMKRALMEAFSPHGLELEFVDRIDELVDVDAVIFGGGSILIDAPNVSPAALEMLLNHEVLTFYVGVGMETDVHDVHAQLVSVARIVAPRSPEHPPWVTNATVIDDLVYSLSDRLHAPSYVSEQVNELLVFPNVELIPMHDAPHWAHVAWERYKNEIAQALDHMIVERGLRPAFALMCQNPAQDDAWAAHEIIGRMKKRSTQFKLHRIDAFSTDIVSLLRSHEAIVTQRYHGIVLAELTGVPYVSISHHDKLRHAVPHRGTMLDYHGVTKEAILKSVERSTSETLAPYVPKSAEFDAMIKGTIDAIRLG